MNTYQSLGVDLPQWRIVVTGAVYETTGPDGTVWQLTVNRVCGYVLTDGASFYPVTDEHGLYYALDIAGARVSMMGRSND